MLANREREREIDLWMMLSKLECVWQFEAYKIKLKFKKRAKFEQNDRKSCAARSFVI